MTTALTSVDALEGGVFARLADDAGVVAALGVATDGGLRVVPGYWLPTEVPEDFPRAALYVPDAVRSRGAGGALQAGRVQVDVWVWHQRPDPDADLEAIDGAMLAAIDRQQWEYRGWRLVGLDQGARPWPAQPGKPIRRTREFLIRLNR